MKKLIISTILAMFAVGAFAQYDIGTSTTSSTDIFGNTVTTHRDAYGRTTGTSTTSSPDYFGNTTTQHRDSQGRNVGTSTTGRTDAFGTTTQQRSNNGTNIWSW